MKKLLLSIVPIVLCAVLLSGFSCAQNGPTKPSVDLSWTQSSTAGVTANCIYRGTTSGTYSMPALFCSSAPITSYSDSSVVRGNTYFYAVTAQAGGIESAYSNEVQADVKTVNPPTGGKGNSH